MGSPLALAIDRASPLGRRAFRWLAGASLAQPLLQADGGLASRLLVVDVSADALRAQRQTAEHILYVHEAGAPPAFPLVKLGRAVSLLRPNLYMEELGPRLSLALQSGRFLSAAPSSRAAYIALDDAALVAAAALAADELPPADFSVSGPESLSHAELVELASELYGGPIALTAVSLAQLEAELLAAGMPHELAGRAVTMDRLLQSSEASLYAEPTGSVAQVTGIAPVTLQKHLLQGSRGAGSGRRLPGHERPQAESVRVSTYGSRVEARTSASRLASDPLVGRGGARASA
jgi:hypothetical protein